MRWYSTSQKLFPVQKWSACEHPLISKHQVEYLLLRHKLIFFSSSSRSGQTGDQVYRFRPRIFNISAVDLSKSSLALSLHVIPIVRLRGGERSTAIRMSLWLLWVGKLCFWWKLPVLDDLSYMYLNPDCQSIINPFSFLRSDKNPWRYGNSLLQNQARLTNLITVPLVLRRFHQRLNVTTELHVRLLTPHTYSCVPAGTQYKNQIRG